MLASVRSATLVGVEGRPVTVEVHVSDGLPAYTVVGLPDTAVRESQARVRAALLSSELGFPLKRITVNLAPASLRKTGAGFELAVALGILVAERRLPVSAVECLAVLGELGLDGSVRAVPGVLALVDALHRSGAHAVVVPERNAVEAALVEGIEVRAARSLLELCDCLTGSAVWPPCPEAPSTTTSDDVDDDCGDPVDLADVRGLANARRALEVAAAGSHHLLLTGPPGVGKTMLARRLATILPPLARDEALEVTRIHSVAGRAPRGGLARSRPFRAPHHTASVGALVGGGSGRPRPGEVTMAHRGTLFLDELGEFPPRALEALRQPLEERAVRIARVPVSLTFPAGFQLVACTNPCPCGRGAPGCECSDAQRIRYRRRLSAPLLDRFDLRLAVRAPEPDDEPGESSAIVRARVTAAVARQQRRYEGCRWRCNAHVPAGALARFVPLRGEAETAWRWAIEERELTGRGAARIRRVARTIADLSDCPDVTEAHLLSAALLRDDVP